MERNDYSRKISERQWNLPDKGELESRREETFIDDIIQKNHIERKLLTLHERHFITMAAGSRSCSRSTVAGSRTLTSRSR